MLELIQLNCEKNWIRRRWKFIGHIMWEGYDNDCRTAMREREKERKSWMEQLKQGDHCSARQSWLVTECQGLMDHFSPLGVKQLGEGEGEEVKNG